MPGRLRINPSLWDKEDVTLWLHWAQREYSLRRPERGRFEMNGRALCLLTKEDFRRRCPSSGDVLYEILQCVKMQRRSQPPKRPSSLPTVDTDSKVSRRTPPLDAQESARGGDSQGWSEWRDSFDSLHLSPLLMSFLIDVPADSPSSPQSQAEIPPQKCRLLWDYVHQLLCDDRYQEYIRWTRTTLWFRVVDPNGLAHLWGNHKHRDNMTYEKMSRALRHYYKLNIIKKERGQKLLFRFLKLPKSKKLLTDRSNTPEEHTQMEDLQEPSSPHDWSEDNFEVSP
uniref:ETS variant transcription factor 7 n=1 Tax=Tetraodon nigroviridis TaxID=99883 RepID=H3BY39_TETNG